MKMKNIGPEKDSSENKYISPEMEFIEIQTEDIITTSEKGTIIFPDKPI